MTVRGRGVVLTVRSSRKMTARAAMTSLGVSSLPSINKAKAGAGAGLDDNSLAGERGLLRGDGESGSSGSGSSSFWLSSSTSAGHYGSSSRRSGGNANASYCAAGLGKFQARELKWHSVGGDGNGGRRRRQQQQQIGRGRRSNLRVFSEGRPEEWRSPSPSPPKAVLDSSHGYGLHGLLLKFMRASESRPSRTKRRSTVQSRGGGSDAPLEESKAASGSDSGTDLEARNTKNNSSEKPQVLSTIPDARGRAGSISFYSHGGDDAHSSGGQGDGEAVVPSSSRNPMSLFWLLGPSVLVASVVLPPLYLRKFFGAVLEDSLVTDFVILFFTETLFFIGAGVFLYMAHYSRVASGAAAFLRKEKLAPPIYSLGYRLSARIALAVGVLLPLASFVIVWPWTGPAAAAALAPYMIGLLAQLGFEHIILRKHSPVWPLVPITFQMYRLHQLNRAAQLVAGLLFSLKGVEATAETMAINGSLQTLLLVLQLLGMLCLWSLGSFLTNHLPTTLDQHTIPSLP